MLKITLRYCLSKNTLSKFYHPFVLQTHDTDISPNIEYGKPDGVGIAHSGIIFGIIFPPRIRNEYSIVFQPFSVVWEKLYFIERWWLLNRQSVWLRNIQLAVFSVVLGLGGVLFNDGEKVLANGWFYGYTNLTWTGELALCRVRNHYANRPSVGWSLHESCVIRLLVFHSCRMQFYGNIIVSYVDM